VDLCREVLKREDVVHPDRLSRVPSHLERRLNLRPARRHIGDCNVRGCRVRVLDEKPRRESPCRRTLSEIIICVRSGRADGFVSLAPVVAVHRSLGDDGYISLDLYRRVLLAYIVLHVVGSPGIRRNRLHLRLRGFSLDHIGHITCGVAVSRVLYEQPTLEAPGRSSSGRYQTLAGFVTPIEECPSGDGAPDPVHIIVRSTAILLPSFDTTFVEKSRSGTIVSGFTVV